MNMARETERKAIEFVLQYEKEQGRTPKELKQGHGYDVDSNDRQIEVKGQGEDNPQFVLLNEHNIKAMQREPNWYLYIVYGIKNYNPKIKIFQKPEVLERAKFSITWEVPLRKADLQ
ncbi:MAG: DUF3883 domain-containing protein [Candidatus Diapherotrites archaeon]|nr:DUF3883 domain-containing protein [Candidatus Diapherotrites archaeon]